MSEENRFFSDECARGPELGDFHIRRYRLRVIASIEAPPVIARILEHLGRDIESVDPAHPSRAPSECDLWI